MKLKSGQLISDNGNEIGDLASFQVRAEVTFILEKGASSDELKSITELLQAASFQVWGADDTLMVTFLGCRISEDDILGRKG